MKKETKDRSYASITIHVSKTHTWTQAKGQLQTSDYLAVHERALQLSKDCIKEFIKDIRPRIKKIKAENKKLKRTAR